MKHFSLLFIGISVGLSACSDSLEIQTLATEDFNRNTIVNVIQERSESYPLTDYNSLNSNSIQTRVGEYVSLDKFIGRGFKVKHYPLEHTMNLGLPIINIEKYIQDNPNSYQIVPVKNGIVKYYGGFMLTKFLSGAQAHVIYNGQYTEYNNYYSLETQMKKEMEATLFKKVDGGIKIHREYNLEEDDNEKKTNINLSIITLGGIHAFSQFSAPIEIKNVDIDLSIWVNSLSDEKSLVIAELPEESLLPITTFIEEDNLKEHIEQIYKYGHPSSSNKILQEPYIKIDVNPATNGVYFISRLVTRYGEMISLGGASGANDIVV